MAYTPTFWKGVTMFTCTSIFTVLGFWVQNRLLETYGQDRRARLCQPPAPSATARARARANLWRPLVRPQEAQEMKRAIKAIREEEIRRINDGHIQENVRGRRDRPDEGT